MMVGKITKRGLGNHRGEEVGFQREDLILEGRLYHTGLGRNHDAPISDSQASYSIVPFSGFKIPWDEIRKLGKWNKVHDNWDIYLETGDQVTLRTEGGKRKYSVYLE